MALENNLNKLKKYGEQEIQKAVQGTLGITSLALIQSELGEFLRPTNGKLIKTFLIQMNVLTRYSSLDLEHHTRRAVSRNVYFLQAATLQGHSKHATCVICQECCTKFGLKEKAGHTRNVLKVRILETSRIGR